MRKQAYEIHQPTGRPMVRGLPVPYVTRWTGELCNDPLQIVHMSGIIRIAYADDLDGVSRINGIQWHRDKIAPRTGEPEWKAVHTARHRACMTAPRCQVCGKRFPAGEPVTFVQQVVPGWQPGAVEPFETMTPPTCRSCAPWAKQLCPWLRAAPSILVEATAFNPVAVFGELYEPSGSRISTTLYLGGSLMPLMMGKQYVVEVTDYRVHDVPPLPQAAR